MASRGERDPVPGAVVARLLRRMVPPPEKVILFGSRAAGGGGEDGDYDILVVAATELDVFERISFVRSLLTDVYAPLDLLVVTPEEYRRYATWKGNVVREAALHGRTLHEAA